MTTKILSKTGEQISPIIPGAGNAAASGSLNVLQRTDTSANWAAANPVLLLGEVGYDSTLNRIKIGDGSAVWTALGFTDGTLFSSTTSDQTVLNTTLVNSGLVVNVEANATYTFESVFLYDGSATGDFKFSFTWPASSVGWYCGTSSFNTAGTAMAQIFSAVSGGTLGVGAVGAGTKVVVRVDGFLKTSATAGTLQHRFAQNVVDAGVASTLFTNSYLRARRVA